MKRLLQGILIGCCISLGATALASRTLEVDLFPVSFYFNGEETKLDDRYEVLNYNGHVYVPIRFIAEQLGAGIGYNAERRQVSVVSDHSPVLSDESGRVFISGLTYDYTEEGNPRIRGHVLADGSHSDHVLTFVRFYYYDEKDRLVGRAGEGFALRAGLTEAFEMIGEGRITGEERMELEIEYFAEDLPEMDREFPALTIRMEGKQGDLHLSGSCWMACVLTIHPVTALRDAEPFVVKAGDTMEFDIDYAYKPTSETLKVMTLDPPTATRLPMLDGTYTVQQLGGESVVLMYSVRWNYWGDVNYVFKLQVEP